MKHYAPNIWDNLQMTNFVQSHFEESPCRKREIIRSYIYRILPKVNQVIYTLDTICMPNNMTLAQAVLQIFCSKGPIWVKCLSLKRGIIWSKFDRTLWKINQVTYIMYSNYMPNIMILAQAVLQIFCSQGCFSTQNYKVRKGRQFSQIVTEFCQKLIRSSTPWTQSVCQISWPQLKRFSRYMYFVQKLLYGLNA